MPTSSLLAVFVFSFAVGLGAVVSPGPVTTAIVSQAPGRGWLVGPLITAGHALLELAAALLIVVGLSGALANPVLQSAVALLGGLLLLWMGGGMLLNALRGRARLPGKDQDSRSLSRWQIVGLGAFTTIANPFWYAWWMTVAAGYLSEARAVGAATVAAFYLGHISADLGWNTLLSTVMTGGRRWITRRVYSILIGLCGAFLIYLGISFLWKGLGI
jgi:threonine/homoserine/homoserine lactone efflux protein